MQGRPKPEECDITWIHKEQTCWIQIPDCGDERMFLRGVVKHIVPLSLNKGNSRVSCQTDMGTTVETRANLLERCREETRMERDLIEMDTINGPQVLNMLKRRLTEKKIHTCLWDSLIIVNPFQIIPQNYGEQALSFYYENIYLRQNNLRQHEPHIYSFIFDILRKLSASTKIQVISISGESGSGKTETNKQALKAISYCCIRSKSSSSAVETVESKILQCDPILEVFGNAKTIKNDNSSRFGKLVTVKLEGEKPIIRSSFIKNYFLEKTRVITQADGERNFHIFYQLLQCMPEDQRALYRLKSLRCENFRYLSEQGNFDKVMQAADRVMWDQLIVAFGNLHFSKQSLHELWSTLAAILLIGNITFDGSRQNEQDPCLIREPELVESVAALIGLGSKEVREGLLWNRKVITKEVLLLPLSKKQCEEGRDSMAKAMYESVFEWIVKGLNSRLGNSEGQVKLLDIYGFEVFEHNSFEQLCVNYTNQRMHQVYLEQVFQQEKILFQREGLEEMISKLSFTDNAKIIDLLDSYTKSAFNLLDESCSLNVKDEDFLQSVRKHHESHEHFPPSNSVNTKKSFIIRHTPGDIEYEVEGFRDKNKDLLREDIITQLSRSKLGILQAFFQQKLQGLKVESSRKFLGVKIRRQVKELMQEMTVNSQLHFIRCIKPNEQKKPFLFIERVCYNQIKYLGILDTVRMRKDSYHIHTPYAKFYARFGILQSPIDPLIELQNGELSEIEIKGFTTHLLKFIKTKFPPNSIDYLFGKEQIFLKMSTQQLIDATLRKAVAKIENASTWIKIIYRHSMMARRRRDLKEKSIMIQRSMRRFMLVARKIRQKKSVLIIEGAWIKYCDQYFRRKKLKFLRVVQDYVHRAVASHQLTAKAAAVRRAKELLRSTAATHRIQELFQIRKFMRKLLLGQWYAQIWKGLSKHYLQTLQRSMKGFNVYTQNSKEIKLAEESSRYRLTLKYRKVLNQSLKGFAAFANKNLILKSVTRVQAYIRMIKLGRLYSHKKQQVILIQERWRKYKYLKDFNLRYSNGYFGGAKSWIQSATDHWKRILFRDLNKTGQPIGIEALLMMQERIKINKIFLFYYLLDFEILCDLELVYPGSSWIDNYLSLQQSAWEKNSPVQYLDVSDQHTLCATVSKVYSWGVLEWESNQKSSLLEGLPIPPASRLHKIEARNRFSVIHFQSAEPMVLGNRQLFEQDSTKAWRTLKNSYVILNGNLLTRQATYLARVSIPEKVTQLSCGMGHCLVRTSLKKIYTWGENQNGQLGHGHFTRILKPKLLQLSTRSTVNANQVCASAKGSLMLDLNGRIWWWGSNGTIKYAATPKECQLFEKSQLLDNPTNYSVVRIVCSWSRSLSIIGLTLGAHEGVFRTSQNGMRRKTYENLMAKWSQNFQTVSPVFVQSIAGYFQEKHMLKPIVATVSRREKQVEHQRIRNKLLQEIHMIQKEEQALLKQKFGTGA